MLIDQNSSYTFRRYFEMRIDALELAEHFGYHFSRVQLNLPQTPQPLDRVERLRDDILETIPMLVRLNEQAKREGLIFPVVKTVAHYARALIRVEYPIKVNDQLQGNIDYLLSVDNLKQISIIEAKQGDLDYGFTQLAAELIALDQWDSSPSIENQPHLVGAVTMGELWRFGILDREQKHIREDINSYRVPEDLDPLLRTLIQLFK